jgi:LytS/YehU family sensor histidine kinase
MLHHPWINLKITLDKQTLTMKLMNGRKGTVNKPALRKGTGIENLKQRLELLYPGKYELEIRKDEEVFVVDLKLELETRREAIDVATGENQAIPKEQYA